MAETTDRISKIEVGVIRQITKRRLMRKRLRAAAFAAIVFGAGLSFMPAYNYAYGLAKDTGFAHYLSLILTDGTSLTGSWGALFLSLIETMPFEGIVIIVSALLVCAYAALRMVRYIQTSRISIA